jgi:hypothetical protein
MTCPYVLEYIIFEHWPGDGFEDPLPRREAERRGDNWLKSQGHHLCFNAYGCHDSFAVRDSDFLKHHHKPCNKCIEGINSHVFFRGVVEENIQR